MKTQLIKGAAVLSAAAAVSLLQALPASAYTIDSATKSILINSSSVGRFFNVEFDGNVATQNVPGLSSSAIFEIVSFNNTSAKFNIDLSNTSSGGITSRTSVIGFNVDAALGSATASGDFNTAALGGEFPNEFGDIGVCFKRGGGPQSCQGGGGAGATADNPISFLATLNFNPGVTAFTLSNFGVRYQAIDGTALGSSGTGKGTPIPTPALLPGLVGLGVAALRKRDGATEDQEAA